MLPCEGCGKDSCSLSRGLCSICMASHTRIRKSNEKRRRLGREHLPPNLGANKTYLCKTPHQCIVCDKTFYSKDKTTTKCCSRECGFELIRLRNPIAWRVSVTVKRARCACCGSWYDAINGRLYCSELCAKIARGQLGKPFECKGCGVTVCRIVAQSLFCSDGCGNDHKQKTRTSYKLSEAYRSSRRKSKSLRRARMRGAKSCEPLDPMMVFERDLWRCGICGRKTLKGMRGTTHDRAPELDHIVSLARGGEHTYANTQCSCRKCNGEKGAGIVGQLHLFPMGYRGGSNL